MNKKTITSILVAASLAGGTALMSNVSPKDAEVIRYQSVSTRDMDNNKIVLDIPVIKSTPTGKEFKGNTIVITSTLGKDMYLSKNISQYFAMKRGNGDEKKIAEIEQLFTDAGYESVEDFIHKHTK